MIKKDLTLDEIVPQAVNANKHTQRGMRLLGESIVKRGWIGAITATADGEVIDGSARRETLEGIGLEEPIFVRTDGNRPVVVIREDIPNADDPTARQLALDANRIAELNLAWDHAVLSQAVSDGLVSEDLIRPEELHAMLPIGEDDGFTPNLAPETSQALISQEQVEKMKRELEAKFKQQLATKPVMCPECAHEFFIDPRSL